MPLVYALVLRGDAIIAEHQAYHGNAAQVVRECLKKAKFEDQLIVRLEGHTVNFLGSDGHGKCALPQTHMHAPSVS